MPPGRSPQEQQADAINDALARLAKIRDELDPRYAPPMPQHGSPLREFLEVAPFLALNLAIAAALIALMLSALGVLP